MAQAQMDKRVQGQLVQLAEIFGRRVEWTTIALCAEEWPDEGAEGAIDLFREAEYAMADYLVAERSVWSGLSDPQKFSLWRMRKNETDWRFLGHFDRWPGEWTKQGQSHA